MTKEEAYNKMSEGYAITHTSFRKDEYLYMDESYIIRDEENNVFENEWDARADQSWNVDWYIYKNRRRNIGLAKQAYLQKNVYNVDGRVSYLPISENNEFSQEEEGEEENVSPYKVTSTNNFYNDMAGAFTDFVMNQSEEKEIKDDNDEEKDFCSILAVKIFCSISTLIFIIADGVFMMNISSKVEGYLAGFFISFNFIFFAILSIILTKLIFWDKDEGKRD